MNILKKILFFALCISMLQGCVAFLAGAATGGLVVYDKRSISTISEDHSTRYKIAQAIKKEKGYKQSHISVSTFNKVILLSGQTQSPALRNKAERIAKKHPGVKRVYNGITIKKPTSAKTRSKDTWTTTKVKTEMLTTQTLRSGQIKVITEDGTVYLMGLVTPRQEALAVKATQKISGVKRVVKLFEYDA